MLRAAGIVFVAAFVAGTFAAWAESPVPDSQNGRYTFKQQGQDLLRLDGRTGQVSLCHRRDAGWSCLTVPDERTALETEIARLQTENANLKREMIARGIPLPSGVRAPEKVEPKSEDLVIKLPKDADLDRVMTFMEKAWRRLLEMVQSMQREKEKNG